MKRQRLGLCVLAFLWMAFGSGCAMKSLRETNQRLRESNDRLIAENNRLEADLDELQRSLALAPPVPETPAPDLNANPAPVTEPVIRAGDADLVIDSLEEGVSVSRTDDGIKMTLEDRIFFSPGQAKLSSRGRQILARVARMIRREYAGHNIRVEGHTDDTPTRKVKHLYPTNWELSTARACSVVRELITHGDVNPSTIFPVGYSYYRPLASGSSSRARSQNRRVEITILDRAG